MDISTAAQIMGKNFFGLSELKQIGLIQCPPSGSEYVPFDENILTTHQANHILIVVPPISMKEIDEAGQRIGLPPIEYEGCGDIPCELYEESSTGGWEMLTTTPLNSTANLGYRQQMVKASEYGYWIPSVQTVAFFMVAMFGRHQKLFEEYILRCTNQIPTSQNNKPTVAWDQLGGLTVQNLPEWHTHQALVTVGSLIT